MQKNSLAATADSTQEQRKGKKKWLLLLILLLLLLSIGAAFVLHGQGYILWPWEDRPDMLSANLTKGTAGITNVNDLQRLTDENHVTLQINTKPVFEDGMGDLIIQNPDFNKFDMQVKIYLGSDETGQEVYDSGRIPPGYYIGEDKLSTNLSRGEHKAIAHLSFWDGETHMTTTSVDMTLVVVS